MDRGEADAVDGNPRGVENPPHFVAAQNDREFLLALGASDVEDGPRATERLLMEELETAEHDGVRTARDLPHGTQVEQILPDLRFTELVGGGMMEAGQLGDGADVGLDGAVGVATKLEVLRHAVAERCHAILSGKGVRGSDRALLPFSRAREGHRAREWPCYPPQAD